MRHKRRTQAFSRTELVVVLAIAFTLGALLMPALVKTREKVKGTNCAINLKEIGLSLKIFMGAPGGDAPYAEPSSVAYGNETQAWMHFQALSNELQTPRVLICNQDRARKGNEAASFKFGRAADAESLAEKGNDAVSYFMAVGFDETMPQAIVAGDRNLGPENNQPAYSMKGRDKAVVVSTNATWSAVRANRIHQDDGFLLLGDGSVEMASDKLLRDRLRLSFEQYTNKANRFVFPQ